MHGSGAVPSRQRSAAPPVRAYLKAAAEPATPRVVPSAQKAASAPVNAAAPSASSLSMSTTTCSREGLRLARETGV